MVGSRASCGRGLKGAKIANLALIKKKFLAKKINRNTTICLLKLI